MILLDFSQIIVANYMAQLKRKPSNDVDENIFRHAALNTIRYYNSMFRSEYGQLIVCVDAHVCWRKEVFPNYKAKRRKTREKSTVDWAQIYSYLDMIAEEIRENFPFRVISVPRAEADDIIATLVMNRTDGKPVVIVSSDGDFLQLQRFQNVRQYSPTRKDFISASDPGLFLREHIIYGDDSDGVPNIRSDDNVFVDESKRKQKPITKQLLEEWMVCDIDTLSEELRRNFYRNQKLIDLVNVPPEIQSAVMGEMLKPLSKQNVYGYLVKHRLSNLMESLADFMAGE